MEYKCRGIRSTSGFDVSERTIYTIYQQLGGTKTIRQLSQLEKRMLRILAIQKQMSSTQAVGDFAKTINKNSGITLKGVMKKLVNAFICGVRKAFSIIEEKQYQFSC